MIRAGGSDEANKLLEHIKSVLEIPDNATSIELRITVDEVVTVKCVYAPNFKNVPRECLPLTDAERTALGKSNIVTFKE